MQHRVAHEPDDAALGADGGQHRIHDEGHVGREDFDQLGVAGMLGREVEDDVALALALAEPRIGLAEHRLDHFGRAALEIVRVGGVDHRQHEAGKVRLRFPEFFAGGPRGRAWYRSQRPLPWPP